MNAWAKAFVMAHLTVLSHTYAWEVPQYVSRWPGGCDPDTTVCSLWESRIKFLPQRPHPNPGATTPEIWRAEGIPRTVVRVEVVDPRVIRYSVTLPDTLGHGALWIVAVNAAGESCIGYIWPSY